MTTRNAKPPTGRQPISGSDGNKAMTMNYSELSSKLTRLSKNQFENPPRGTLTNAQLNGLDRWLAGLGRKRFDAYRFKVGVEPGTPNIRLSRKSAYLLMRAIVEGERP